MAGSTRVIYLSDHGDNLGARSLWGKSTMYEESAAVPMIAAGPGLGKGQHVRTPVSHLDMYPSILQAVGGPPPAVDLRGQSIFDIARQAEDPCRTVLSEYHAAGSVSAAFMLRQMRYKYIYYTGYRPELFDLDADPEELHDLAGQPAMQPVLDEFERQLRAWCEPEAVDRQAKADQAALIAKHGGVDRILRRGGSSYTPIPGEEVRLIDSSH